MLSTPPPPTPSPRHGAPDVLVGDEEAFLDEDDLDGLSDDDEEEEES